MRKDRVLRFYSANFPDQGIIECDLDHLVYDKSHGWANYAKGIFAEFFHRGLIIPFGFDSAVSGDLPTASGLSSSASIELLFATMLNTILGYQLSKPDLAVLGKKVENEYIGVNCGIMDQFIIANGQKDHAILLNTSTLAFKQVPILLKDYDIVICNSKVKRGLADTKYNERRSECDKALAILKTHTPIANLCDLTPNQFAPLERYLTDAIVLRRARHAITENARTVGAYDQLLKGDLLGFGAALDASHVSLRDDYEVSCKELDILVSLAKKNGSIGSRMTGAGFGGCTVNLVPKTKLKTFMANVAKGYLQETGITVEIYVAQIADGTKEIQ
jgi:galactokinase